MKWLWLILIALASLFPRPALRAAMHRQEVVFEANARCIQQAHKDAPLRELK